MEYYREVYEQIISNLKNKRTVDIGIVIKAFNLAEVLHKSQRRKDGSPYITHPIEVALILERMDFDTNVISAAILHDVVEDCGYTIKEMEKDFNKTIARIVDAVTAIELDMDQYDEDDFPKLMEETKTYQKLISIGKENLFAFYIKFADRLHNLRTISFFPKYKQLAKVKETERWIVPFLKILKASEFYRKITNECFKIQNMEVIESYQSIYNKYFDYNKDKYLELKDGLSLAISKYQSRRKTERDLHKIVLTPCTELETFNIIREVMDTRNATEIKQSYLNKFPITKLFLIFNNNINEKDLNDFLLDFILNSKNKFIRITGYGIDEFTEKRFIIVTDKYRNKFQLYIFNLKEYLIFRNGTITGVDLSFVDEVSEEVSSNYISVKTRSDEVIIMPENSTILDFAFRIHKDFLFSCRYAYLNDSPNRSPIYTKLSDGDKINLVIEKDENGHCKNIAQIRWIMYAKSETAQRSLIRYFESL